MRTNYAGAAPKQDWMDLVPDKVTLNDSTQAPERGERRNHILLPISDTSQLLLLALTVSHVGPNGEILLQAVASALATLLLRLARSGDHPRPWTKRNGDATHW
jgi:hypothetical protein